MTRFIRILCFIFGVLLYGLTAVRLVQPAESTDLYHVIYGDLETGGCCGTLIVNPDKGTIDRVTLPVLRQPITDSQISPSNQWRYALVQTPQQILVYFLPVADRDVEPLRLQDAIGRGSLYHWDVETDTLYYLNRVQPKSQRTLGFQAALFSVRPDATEPIRLSEYGFGGVRTIQQQPLPTVENITPTMLWFLSANVLVIGGAISRKRW